MRHYLAILGFSLVILVLSATTSISTAQEVSQESEGIEISIVTGMRIGRRNFEANSPIVTVSEAEIQRAAEVLLEIALQLRPQFTPDMDWRPVSQFRFRNGS